MYACRISVKTASLTTSFHEVSRSQPDDQDFI